VTQSTAPCRRSPRLAAGGCVLLAGCAAEGWHFLISILPNQYRSHLGAFLPGVVSNPKDWPAQLRHPAPWGGIGSRKFAIASPRSSVRTVSDVRAVQQYWDKVLDLAAYMAGSSLERPDPQRMQHDVDISVGCMHSGCEWVVGGWV
jgi:hypothetical protein